MVPIAEDALLNEKFSLQGMSTGKASGRRKVVSTIFITSFSFYFLFLAHFLTRKDAFINLIFLHLSCMCQILLLKNRFRSSSQLLKFKKILFENKSGQKI